MSLDGAMPVTAERKRAPSGPSTFSDATKLSLDAQLSLAIQVLGSSFYHSARRDFIERWHKGLMFMIVGISAAALGGTFGGWWQGRLLFAVPVLAGMAILVFDLPGRAKRHEVLVRRYTDLLADIENGPSSTPTVKRWRRRFFDISAGEPPVFNALVATSYNAACQTTMLSGARVKVPWHHRALKNVCRFDSREYERMFDPAHRPEVLIDAVLDTLSDGESDAKRRNGGA